MSHPGCSPSPNSDTLAQPEAYVLSLLSEGKFELALEAIGDFGDGELYWPDFHNHAQRLMLAADLKGGAEAAGAAISLDPQRPEAHELLGEFRLRERRWSDAEDCFKRALKWKPRSAAALYGLGRALRQQGKRRQALESLVMAIEGDPRPDWIAELQRAMRRRDRRKPAGGRSSRGDAKDPLLQRAERAIRRAREAACESLLLPTLSVCMIARDEHDTLPRCLRSVRGLADEIIVVDTGSDDDTAAIAQDGGASVHHFAWCDDFSAARNESLRRATSDWVLVLDADDELGQWAGLKEYLAAADDVRVCSMRTRIPHRGQAGETVVEHPRLFRNHMGFHYRGPVHEQLYDGEGNPAAADAALDLFAYHHGYLEDEPAQRKRHERNLRILRAWIEREPQDAWAHFCLGQTYYTNREMDKAIPHLASALQYAQSDRAYRPKAYAYLASAQVGAGRPEQAERTCRTALEESPNQAELLFCLGHALESGGRTKEAAAAYEEATRGRFGPMLAHHDFTCRDLKPLARLAEIHASRGRFDEAEECLRRAQRIRGQVPGLEVVRERIASARRLSKRAAVAQDVLSDARAAVAADNEDLEARVRLAAAVLGSGNTAQAEEHIDAALALDPACAEALNLKGVVLCSRSDHGSAAEHFQRAAALRPDYADALCNLGAARVQMNDIVGAENAFRQAVETDGSCFAAHLGLGEIARSRSDNEAAIASYTRAVETDAAEPDGWLGLAKCYLESGVYEPASKCYAKAAEVGGNAPHIMAEIERARRRLASLACAVSQ